MKHRDCTVCGASSKDVSFSHRSCGGRFYYATRCCHCVKKVAKEKGWDRGDTKAQSSRKKERIKRERKLNQRTEYYIYHDSRRSDRKRGLTNDLDKDFIRDTIANGCVYCGETTLRMTLDRKDNAKGHTRDNVEPACIRCNYIRRDLPFEIWLRFVAAVRSSREDGLFGDWVPRTR